MLKKYPTFCVLPFTHISTLNNGTYRVCCQSLTPITDTNNITFNVRANSIIEVWNSDSYKSIRNDMLDGKWPSNCAHCKTQEENGMYSPRNLNNEQHMSSYESYDSYIQDAISNAGTISSLPVDVDLKIGTLCNLKCIMCYAGASSLHQEEINTWKSQGISLPSMAVKWETHVASFDLNSQNFRSDILDIMQSINNLRPCLKTAKFLSLVGGEPLINPFTTAILEDCIENQYNETISLTIITNLSAINRRVFTHLNKFKHTDLYISYDHVDPEKFEFIRYPAVYETFQKNLHAVFDFKHITKKLSTTWSIFNIFDFEVIFTSWERIRQQYNEPLHIQVNLVNDPNYFSIRYLNKIQRATITDRIEIFLKTQDLTILHESPTAIEQLASIIEYIKETPDDYDEVITERLRVLELYDVTRGTNYKTIFTHL
jgi:MoaA/NifB/PqqE/SkfB family radical SAM enzyme